VALGVLYLLGAVLQWRSCWLAGGLSAALFLLLFWRSQLPFQALLQGYYVAVAAHGWWHWGGHGGGRSVTVHRWPLRRHLLAVSAVVLASALSLRFRDASPLSLAALDAATAWASVLATWLVARKVLENWLYWIVIDAAAVFLYWQSGLPATALLFAAYTVIAVFGWMQWQRSSPAPSTP
jgi:nicotinamide mononucleotide transporter